MKASIAFAAALASLSAAAPLSTREATMDAMAPGSPPPAPPPPPPAAAAPPPPPPPPPPPAEAAKDASPAPPYPPPPATGPAPYGAAPPAAAAAAPPPPPADGAAAAPPSPPADGAAAAPPPPAAPGNDAAGALSDVDILQFALTLENLEDEFYKQGLAKFAGEIAAAVGGAPEIPRDFDAIARDEQTHVEALSAAVTKAGATPVAKCEYKFPLDSAQSFVATAGILEGVGTSAYLGAAAAIQDKTLLTTAGSILTVEARHSAVLRSLVGQAPAPQPFDNPLGPNQVFSLATPFIAKCPDSNAPLPFKAFPALTLVAGGAAAGQGAEQQGAGQQGGQPAGAQGAEGGDKGDGKQMGGMGGQMGGEAQAGGQMGGEQQGGDQKMEDKNKKEGQEGANKNQEMKDKNAQGGQEGANKDEGKMEDKNAQTGQDGASKKEEKMGGGEKGEDKNAAGKKGEDQNAAGKKGEDPNAASNQGKNDKGANQQGAYGQGQGKMANGDNGMQGNANQAGEGQGAEKKQQQPGAKPAGGQAGGSGAMYRRTPNEGNPAAAAAPADAAAPAAAAPPADAAAPPADAAADAPSGGAVKPGDTLRVQAAEGVDLQQVQAGQVGAAFVTVQGPVAAEARVTGEREMEVTVPQGVAGLSYMVLTRDKAKVDDASTVAGPLAVEVAV